MAPAVVLSSMVSILGNWPWTLEPLTDWVMLTTPVDLADRLLLDLGSLARPLALLGGFALFLGIGGVGGLIAGPAPSPSDRGVFQGAGYAGLRVIRLAATAIFLGLILAFMFPAPALAPALVLGAVYVGLLAVPPLAGQARHDAGPSRRDFIRNSARVVGPAAALVALFLLQPWYRARTLVTRSGRLFVFRVPAPRRSGFTIAGLTPEVTPPSQFYYMSKNLVDPDLSAGAWRLRVDGLVNTPRRIGVEEILAMPPQSQYVTQECVSNPVGGPLISCALFTGVPLSHLLDLAGPLPHAATVVMRAPDGHADSIPLTVARQDEVLVAYAMDGAYLEPAHGYPARILVPGSYGFKSIKWVEHLELVSGSFSGTWQERGWTASGLVHSMARIDVARSTAKGVAVAGVAFAGTRGVRAVQVRANGGPWQPAILHTPPLSPLTWVQWRCLIRARGKVTLEARTIDGMGKTQESRASDIYPAGATGYHQITVNV
jgi:DMSO/TMAO reductase YedYZ molybdopterin-dependent catalytic subunit